MSVSTRSPPVRVSALRTLSLVLAFAAAVGLIFGTAGFTAMEADRGVTANITDDENAYLGYAPVTDAVSDGESATVVEYRNQFATDLGEFDVDVSIADGASTDATLESVETPSSLDRGDAPAVDVTLRCAERETVPLLFEADGSGSGVSVSLDRVHTVTCVPAEPTVTGVRYAGVGNAFVDTDGRNGTVEAVVWLTDAEPGADGSEGALRAETVSTLNTSAPVRPQLSSNASNEPIAVIEFPDQGVAFFHPSWNGENHAAPGAGSGVGFADVPLDGATVSNTSVVDEGAD